MEYECSIVRKVGVRWEGGNGVGVVCGGEGGGERSGIGEKYEYVEA